MNRKTIATATRPVKGKIVSSIIVLSTLAIPCSSEGLTEEQAIGAYDSLHLVFSSRNPEAFAALMHYPHVRPSSGGEEQQVFSTPEEYAILISAFYPKVIASGWDHTKPGEREVFHLGEAKAHVAGKYSRYSEDGSVIFSNQASYVVTKEDDGSIGIQARFPAGRKLPTEAERNESKEAAIGVVNDFMTAFNARDEEAWAATLNYPHVRVASGTVKVSRTAKEYTDNFDFDAFASRFGWHHSGWDSIEVVQVGTQGVNVALTFSRYDANNIKISTNYTLYLITHQDGHWGIKARSSFAP